MKLFLLIWWNLVAGTPLKFHCCPTHGEEGVSRVLIYGKGQVRDRPLEKSLGGEVPRKYSYRGKLIKEVRKMLTQKVLDQCRFLRNCPPTLSLSQNFAQSEK